MQPDCRSCLQRRMVPSIAGITDMDRDELTPMSLRSQMRWQTPASRGRLGSLRQRSTEMDLIARVKGILLSPSAEWPVIDQEAHTVRDLYLSYLLPLAGIAALATFIGTVTFGYDVGPVSVRYASGQALGIALMGLAMSMVMVYVLGWIITALAPTFKGERSFVKGFTVAAFSMTAAIVGGFSGVLPALSWLLGMLGGLYSLFLLYKGLPILMKTPPGKAMGYTVVVVLAAIVCNVILAVLMAGILPHPWSNVGAGGGSGSGVTITTPAGPVSTTQGKLEEMGRQLEAAARKVESASQTQDPQAIARAATEAVAAVTGVVPGGGRVALSSEALKTWLPLTLQGMKRETFEVQGGTAMGIAGATARATYRDGARVIDLEVLDAGGASGILAMISGLQSGERETDTTHERSFQLDRRKYTEKRWKDESQAELNVVLANGVMVNASGRGVPLAALNASVAALGLERLEMVQPAPSARPGAAGK